MNKLLLTFLLSCFMIPLSAQEIINPKTTSGEVASGNSLGFTILGDGLGVMFRHTFEGEDQLGLSLHYNPISLIDDSRSYWYNGMLLKSEYNLYMGHRTKTKRKVRKIKKHYLSFKQGFGYSAGPYKGQDLRFWVSSTTISWHQQRFKAHKPNMSVGFDAGLSFDYLGSPDLRVINSPVSIYIRWDWAYFLGG